MIEKTVFDYLNTNMNVPVYMELPESVTAEEFVVVEKIGGDITDYIRSATIAIQSYSLKSLYRAAMLNEAVHAVMDVMAANTDVSQCQMTADTNFTDTSTKRYRYQCLYNIHY